MTADYRIGNGAAGNVGAETITRIGFGRTTLPNVHLRPRNPLPATGGTPPETVAAVKLRAPLAYRRDLVRAITAEDYAHTLDNLLGAAWDAELEPYRHAGDGAPITWLHQVG